MERRRVRSSAPADFKGAVVKLFIVLFLGADAALVVFAVRHCSGTRTGAPPAEQPRTPGPNRSAVQPKDRPKPVPRAVQVEVLNGCGAPRIADRFTVLLRRNGFDVVRSGNYETFGVAKTLVIDRKGNPENALRIAETLGLSRERALEERSESYLVDATVILGADFRQLASWKKMEKERAGTEF